MSDNVDPVAEVPEESNLVTPIESAVAESGETAKTSKLKALSQKQWPWFAVAGVAVVTGVAGFAAGSASDHHGRDFQPGQLQGAPDGRNRGVDPDGDNWTGGGRGPGNGQQLPGQPLPGQPLPGNGQQNPGQPLPGQGVDPDGDNWTGTNHTKPGGPIAPTNPSASPSASASATS